MTAPSSGRFNNTRARKIDCYLTKTQINSNDYRVCFDLLVKSTKVTARIPSDTENSAYNSACVYITRKTRNLLQIKRGEEIILRYSRRPLLDIRPHFLVLCSQQQQDQSLNNTPASPDNKLNLPFECSLSRLTTIFFHSSSLSCSGRTRHSIRALSQRKKLISMNYHVSKKNCLDAWLGIHNSLIIIITTREASIYGRARHDGRGFFSLFEIVHAWAPETMKLCVVSFRVSRCGNTRAPQKKNEKKKSPGECFETGLDGFVTEANASQDRSDILGGSCLNTTF